MLLARKLVAELAEDGVSRRIYLPALHSAEKEVARRLAELMAAIRPGRFRGAEKRIARFEREHRISFSPR